MERVGEQRMRRSRRRRSRQQGFRVLVKSLTIVLVVTGIMRNLLNRFEQIMNAAEVKEIDLLIHQTEGTVDHDNYTYYSLHEEGALKIILETKNGDADLYISSSRRPQYYPESYDFASTTCGMDLVEVPEDLRRPILVGVYGHPAHRRSAFTLSMYVNFRPNETYRKYKASRIGFKEKLNFIIRNTAMWRVFELIEGVFFII
ncbi:PREDICTED: UPF0669 protein v1g209471-like [Nicrophorus vespilloides]|uniref:UPF0669 protein v1g209471-like n=1 Tax=Nicrophorus vespilloides TaxID=110193 RepID=A0ABM1M8H5_NICVS|nr:PREDICTED: UPF0669 protein v1g209471-like [Nicrophorus vespilloides]